jgi:hypothetical protein
MVSGIRHRPGGDGRRHLLLLITHRVPFAEAPRAYEQIDSRPEESLGVLLEY